MILVISRPRPGVTPEELRPHLSVEMDTLRQLHACGQLHEAFSPGGPPDIDAARRITDTLPLDRGRADRSRVYGAPPVRSVTRMT
jgi:hypothetical protein